MIIIYYHIQGVFDGICLILLMVFSAQLCRWVTKHQFGRRWSFRILQPKGLRSPIDEASQQVGVCYSSLLGAHERHDEEAAKVAKATSEPPSRRSQISEGETTVRSLSQSQLGSILEEMDDEAALEAGIDHPFCPQNDSESGRGMSQGRNTLS